MRSTDVPQHPTGLKFPKPRPAALERADRRRARTTVDERESDKVKARSGGRCEAVITGIGRVIVAARCHRRACHIHHMLGGHGVRARGESALAIRKQHCCAKCHQAITQHILTRIGGSLPRWDDAYTRAR